MITKFKIFESINEGRPKINDYVLCDMTTHFSDADKLFPVTNKAIEFINNNIGLIYKQPNQNSYLVKYFNIPEDLEKFIFHYSDYRDYEGPKKGNSILVDIENIKYWSINKQELMPFIQANKYNL